MYWTMHLHGAPRLVNHAAATVGTNIFTFGGASDVPNHYNFYKPIDIHVLDTVKLEWSKLELQVIDNILDIPSQRYGHTAVAFGSNIYLWGGNYTSSGVCNSLYCFDTNTLTWSKLHVKGNIPDVRDGHSACIIENCMYIFGGYKYLVREFASKLYMFNFQTMMWSIVITTGDSPLCRDFHTATAIDNKMYIFGGRSDGHAPTNTNSDMYCASMFCLDTATGKWECDEKVSADHPIPRRSHSAFVHNGFIYIFGGYNKNKELHFNDIHRYDPVGCTWTKILPVGMPPRSRRRQICQVVNDRIFISGGTGPSLPNLPVCRLQLLNLPKLLDLKNYDDLHILDMNPSLKDKCMVSVWKGLIQMNVNNLDDIDDLCIPLPLKRELGAFNPL